MDLELDGRGVLITGAGGLLGSAMAVAFSREGALVAVHHRDDRDRASADALAATIGGVCLQADLAVEAEADALIPAAAAALGRLDICVANAGRFPAEEMRLVDMSLERWHETFDDNLVSTFLTTRAFMRHVERETTGTLILVGSAAGQFGHTGRADYAAAKGAILTGFVATAKTEMAAIAPRGRVNAVMPGWISSPDRLASISAAEYAESVATQALPWPGRPEDVASAVLWLASPGAGHVTGAVLPVSGGMDGRLLQSLADPAHG